VGLLAAVVGCSSSPVAAPRPAPPSVPPSASPLPAPTGPVPVPPTAAQCERWFGVDCYDPQQLQAAYDLGPLLARGLTGAGRTIVIVDPFGSPTVAADLKVFDLAFHLPDPPSFRIIAPAGPIPKFDPKGSEVLGSAAETSLDVQWAHAMAPGANLLLVETPVAEIEGTSGFPQIVAAENYVVDHRLGDVISQSFDATEDTFPSPASLLSFRSAFVNAAAHGVSVLASSGDSGAAGLEYDAVHYYPYRATGWPATDPLVTAVGGTYLQLDARGRRLAPDSVWNDTSPRSGPAASSGGLSKVFSRPAYQNGVAAIVGTHRGIPDISLSAAGRGSVLVYLGYPVPGAPGAAPAAPGFVAINGTSESCPLLAGIVAIADQLAGHDLGLLNPALYRLGAEHAPGLVPVTRGDNTVSFVGAGGRMVTVTGFQAGPGYNLATGLGTVDAALLVPELAGKP